MKKEKKIITFICDRCGTHSEEKVMGSGFPYDKGWTYIYNFSYKLHDGKIHTFTDKHFCCINCLRAFLAYNAK